MAIYRECVQVTLNKYLKKINYNSQFFLEGKNRKNRPLNKRKFVINTLRDAKKSRVEIEEDNGSDDA